MGKSFNHDVVDHLRDTVRNVETDPDQILLSLIVALFTLDIGTTAYALSLGLAEGNPAMAALLEHLGIIGLAIAKLLVLIWIVYAPRFTARPKLTFRSASAAIILMYLAVVGQNTYHILGALNTA